MDLTLLVQVCQFALMLAGVAMTLRPPPKEWHWPIVGVVAILGLIATIVTRVQDSRNSAAQARAATDIRSAHDEAKSAHDEAKAARINANVAEAQRRVDAAELKAKVDVAQAELRTARAEAREADARQRTTSAELKAKLDAERQANAELARNQSLMMDFATATCGDKKPEWRIENGKKVGMECRLGATFGGDSRLSPTLKIDRPDK